MLKRLLLILLSFLCLCSCGRTDFVHVRGGMFEKDGAPYRFVGTNFWYGPVLASEGEGGDYERLILELDSLKAIGITNLRVLAGAEGPDGVPTRVSPTLLKSPGVYNDTLLRGLDRFMAELGKRDMTAVLFLNNAWEWSGGFGVYLEWAGAGKALIPAIDGYWPFMQQMAQFSTNRKAQELYFDHVRTMVSRRNTVTGKLYKDDPALFSWQIANEPRCFSAEPEVREGFVKWIHEAAHIIKECDPNHMVSTGNEGIFGCEQERDLYEAVHDSEDIDYLTVHIWPYNWEWISAPAVELGVETAIRNSLDYLAPHFEYAEATSRPVVVEEFGYPRDGFEFSRESSVSGRDRYYSSLFALLKERHPNLGGLNFWSWGGFGKPIHEFWEKGDDYVGDPAQEAQGLNSVFFSDSSTVALIRETAASISEPRFTPVWDNEWMLFSEDGPQKVKVVADAAPGTYTVEIKTDKDEPYRTLSLKKKAAGVDTLCFDPGLVSGFYNVRICSDSFVIGCSPEKVVSPPDAREDFDLFWENNLKELAQVDPRPGLTLLPERSGELRKVYRVDMYSWGGEKISGILYEPVKEGLYPAFISYMGYNSDVWYSEADSAPEQIDFTLCVRSQALNKLTPGEGWIRQGLDDRDNYYYRGAYLDVVRAIDFVASRHKTDPGRIFAQGGSQGGAFTLVAASLDKRIKAAAPYVPFMSDFPDYLEIASWPANEILPEAERLGLGREELLGTLSYFDVKNFTPRISCPVLMAFGLQDDVCPPHTNFAAFNNILSDKQWICYPRSGHHVEQEPDWWTRSVEFFGKYL